MEIKAVTYIRISTHNQRHGRGLELQEKACQLVVVELAIKQNLEITKILVFSDVISGTTEVTARDGLCAAINALSEGDLFVVDDIERLAREDSFVLPRILSAIFLRKAKLIVVQEIEKKYSQESRLK
jgi:DNA invertase Pin-like site-specific DNA recombinase